MPKRTRFFYDTEFIEDGRTIDLVSIGIVREDGREYYAVTDIPDHVYRMRRDAWLAANVLPFLPLNDGGFLDLSHPDVKPRSVIRNEVLDFLTDDAWPQLWAWYGAYDHVALAQLWGRMIDLPSKLPMFTNDIRQLWDAAGRPTLPQQDEGTKHHALYDARHDRRMYESIKGAVHV